MVGKREKKISVYFREVKRLNPTLAVNEEI